VAVSQYYDAIAASYDAVRYGRQYDRVTADLELDFVRGHLRPGPCLEVGAGTGRVTTFLLDHGHDVVAVDVSAGMLSKLREKVPPDHPGLRTGVLDVHALEAIDDYGRYPSVVALRMLPHIPDPVPAMRKLRDAGAPDGVVIFDLWNKWSYRPVLAALGLSAITVETRYDRIHDMRRLIADAGLRVREWRGFGLPHLRPLLALERSRHLRCDHLAQRIVWVCERA
jgi:SAM-dependent methyltransferase